MVNLPAELVPDCGRFCLWRLRLSVASIAVLCFVCIAANSLAYAADQELPQAKNAQQLFAKWKKNARANGMIPGGTIAALDRVVERFVRLNPDDKRSPALKEFRGKLDIKRDWKPSDVVKLLDEVVTIYDNLPTWVLEEDRFQPSSTVRPGKPLPKELQQAPWGRMLPNGLRCAWLLDPQQSQYHLMTPLKSRILVHNSGRNTVFFRANSWNQSSGHKARDANGETVAVDSTHWTTIGQIQICRLAPGEFVEFVGAGIGIGANTNIEDWRNTRVGTWIDAPVGAQVTFTPSEMMLAGRQGNLTLKWWSDFVRQRIARDLPLPNSEAERRRLLDRVVSDLFGANAGQQELDDFAKDRSPATVDNLVKRLSRRAGTRAYSGPISSGSTTFTVLPIDPVKAAQPRTASGPGRYQLAKNVLLRITGTSRDGQYVHDAALEMTNKNGKVSKQTIELPPGRATWKMAWSRKDATQLLVAAKNQLRTFHFGDGSGLKTEKKDPAQSKDLPPEFRDALGATLAGNDKR